MLSKKSIRENKARRGDDSVEVLSFPHYPKRDDDDLGPAASSFLQ